MSSNEIRRPASRGAMRVLFAVSAVFVAVFGCGVSAMPLYSSVIGGRFSFLDLGFGAVILAICGLPAALLAMMAMNATTASADADGLRWRVGPVPFSRTGRVAWRELRKIELHRLPIKNVRWRVVLSTSEQRHGLGWFHRELEAKELADQIAQWHREHTHG